jgi:hypothetical protein
MPLQKPERVPREAIPSQDDIRDILEIALARAWRADANIKVSIRELDRACAMHEARMRLMDLS